MELMTTLTFLTFESIQHTIFQTYSLQFPSRCIVSISGIVVLTAWPFDSLFGILMATGHENRISGVRAVPRFLNCPSVSNGISTHSYNRKSRILLLSAVLLRNNDD